MPSGDSRATSKVAASRSNREAFGLRQREPHGAVCGCVRTIQRRAVNRETAAHLFCPARTRNLLVPWPRDRGIFHAEKNHDPRHHHDQSRPMPARYRGDIESADVTESVVLTGGALSVFTPSILHQQDFLCVLHNFC